MRHHCTSLNTSIASHSRHRHQAITPATTAKLLLPSQLLRRLLNTPKPKKTLITRHTMRSITLSSRRRNHRKHSLSKAPRHTTALTRSSPSRRQRLQQQKLQPKLRLITTITRITTPSTTRSSRKSHLPP